MRCRQASPAAAGYATHSYLRGLAVGAGGTRRLRYHPPPGHRRLSRPANLGPTVKGMNSVFGAGLYNSWFWVDHTAGVGGMFATQVLPYFHPPAYDLFCQFETAVYDHLSA